MIRVFLILSLMVVTALGGSLNFNNSNTNVNATGTNLDNLTTMTIMAWVRFTSASDTNFIWRKDGAKDWQLAQNVSPSRIDGYCARATTYMESRADPANFTAWGTGKWLFVVSIWNPGGVNADQRTLIGDLTTRAAEPSSYTSQTVGSGAAVNDTGAAVYIGASGAGTDLHNGDICFFAVYNRAMSVNEVLSHQYRPRVVNGAVGFWWPGSNGTTNVPDYSGNKYTMSVSNSSVASGCPIAPMFAANWLKHELKRLFWWPSQYEEMD